MNTREQKAIESTYYDVMTVRRTMKTKVNGETKIQLNPTPVYSSIKCAVSKSKNGQSFNVKQTIDVNEINYSLSLFCNPSFVILVGDIIDITFKNGMVKRYKTGEGFYYSSHAEIPILRDVDA